MSLVVRSLEVRRGAFLLGPLSFSLPPAGAVALLGPSGSGKSTLLAALAGLLPARGEAWLGDVALHALSPERRGVGYVPQGGWLFPHLDVAANVGFALPAAGRADRIADALSLADASHLAGRSVRELSGGETMRVALARAIARRPRLLLLDEPLAGLDPGGRTLLAERIATLPARTGATLVLATHDRGEALRIARHGGILEAGRLRSFDRAPETLRDAHDAAPEGVQREGGGVAVASASGAHVHVRLAAAHAQAERLTRAGASTSEEMDRSSIDTTARRTG